MLGGNAVVISLSILHDKEIATITLKNSISITLFITYLSRRAATALLGRYNKPLIMLLFKDYSP
jgi:hypothetical protein